MKSAIKKYLFNQIYNSIYLGVILMEKIKNFNIKNFGPINEADINIGKINIVAGHNSTGKSTASKFLYCYLKSSCSKRQDFAYESLKYQIFQVLSRLNHDYRYSRKIRDWGLEDILDDYERSKDEFYGSDDNEFDKYFNKEIEDIDNFIELIQENDEPLHVSMMKNLLKIEFSRDFGSMDYESVVTVSVENSNDIPSSSESKPSNYSLFDIYDVFYIDTFSIFDVDRLPSRFRYRRQGYVDHVEYLKSMLRDEADESIELFDEKRNKKIIEVENKISKIIKGTIEFNRGNFVYTPKNSEPCSMLNTASGIKQIGVIQRLLSNRKLKEGSFLIIDEPEVNLHPEWQFKLAEILVILVKDLNISIYINTHSPMLVESMEVFTKYYELEEDTNFYLTKRFDERTYDFVEIGYDNLYDLYDNLSRPFDSIEVFRLKTEYRKGN